MLILNFAHSLSDEHVVQIEAITGCIIDDIRNIPVQINENEPLETQMRATVDAVPLSSEEWQTRSLLINPPGYAPAACVLLTELHGCIGHFPTIIHLQPKSGPVTTYEVAELLNLQTIRTEVRKRR